MFENTSLIITSIASPNAVMKTFARECLERGIEFIVIGDVSSPADFQLAGCNFFSLDKQRSLPYRLAKLLPERHYARKNLGYLLAKKKEIIIETDDDNFPKENFWQERKTTVHAQLITDTGWINAYHYFSKEHIWPRGFPLEEIQHQVKKGMPVSNTSYSLTNCLIRQGLADENPDVDAVYRMTNKLPVTFDQGEHIALGKNVWCPFNSQNTTWYQAAFPLLYLPSYCSFRMTDIWRSFIAQRIAWTCGWTVMFHESTVWQERNEHNLLKDFADEVPGYLNNAKIGRLLSELDLKEGLHNLPENLFRCYSLMVKEKWIDEKELLLVAAWIQDIA